MADMVRMKNEIQYSASNVIFRRKMPEGVEVSIVANELNELLTGKSILGFKIGEKAKQTNLEYLPSCSLILGVTSWGKKILFFIKAPQKGPPGPTGCGPSGPTGCGPSGPGGPGGPIMYGSQPIYIIGSFLAMEGRWGLSRGNNTHLSMTLGTPSPAGNSSGVVVVGEPYMAIFFDDSCRFGSNKLLRTNYEYADYLKNIGPDLLKKPPTYNEWYTVIKGSRIKQKEIADFLLEQKYFSGVGNYLKSDILYHARIKPNRTLESLTDQEVKMLLDSTLFIMKESLRHGGLTIKSFWSPTGKKGVYPTLVYEKAFDSNGFSVIKSVFKDGRATYWVQETQF